MLKLLALAGSIAIVDTAHAQTSAEPTLVADGVISTALNETFPAIDPVDGSLWYSAYEKDFDRQVVMRAARKGSGGSAGWDKPERVPFVNTDEWGGRAPRFSPDGKRLYFTSGRPIATGQRPADMNLWVAERSATGEWSAPAPLPASINGPTRDMHSSETTSGDFFFASGRPGGLGRSDIWRSRRVGDGWAVPEHLPATINNENGQPDLFVSPHGTWMILVVTNDPKGLGGDDLFVSTLENGEWTAPRHLPAPINSPSYEYGPSLSPDGRTLYFTSGRRGNEDLYQLPVAALGLSSGTNR